jgi:hypothetical protein
VGSAILWRTGFADDNQTYGSRERAKKKKAQEEATRIEILERKQNELREIYFQHWRN